MKIAGASCLLAACLCFTACSDAGGSAPGAVSEGEARALDEAAEMLDQKRLPDGAVPDLEAPATDSSPTEVTGDNAR